MKKKQPSNKSAQSVIAYVIFIGIFIAAFSAIAWMLRHKLQASYKESADAFGEGRQLGSLTTTGSTPKFEFPVLPGATAATATAAGASAVTSPGGALSKDLQEKLENFTNLSKIAVDARLAAIAAREAVPVAKKAARIAREDATSAREDAASAREQANSARDGYSDCNSYGSWGCDTLLAEAERLERVATEKEVIAAKKEGIATEKEKNYQEKLVIANNLVNVANDKEAIAAAAGNEAQAAAEAQGQAK